MSVLNVITSDLGWREAEIASMRLILSAPATTNTQKIVLLRAAWALLYAHYEGFCKNTLVIYYDFIARSGVACKDLPANTKIYALRKKLTQLRNLEDHDLVREIDLFDAGCLSVSPIFPDVDTQSNLWPSVLIDLLETADLSPTKVQEHEIKLKTLVSRRNKIAHGENNIITEVDYYKTYESAVYDVMYDLAMQVDGRLSLPPFAA